MFNWSDNITLPKLTDVLDASDTPMNFMQVFTYAWVWFLGGWFFAGVIGAFAGALYIKSKNAMVPVAFLIIMCILFGGLFTAEVPGIPSASIFLYIMGLLCSFAVGILLYTLFVSKKG